MTKYTEQEAFIDACEVGARSPCVKSKRGVVIFDRHLGLLVTGFNQPPPPFTCDGSDACKEACGQLCIHAEMDALMQLGRPHYHAVTTHGEGLELLHVKVGPLGSMPSGPPSCWQCSRQIVYAGIKYVWLYHEDGLRRYDGLEFHELTLQHHSLPVIR